MNISRHVLPCHSLQLFRHSNSISIDLVSFQLQATSHLLLVHLRRLLSLSHANVISFRSCDGKIELKRHIAHWCTSPVDIPSSKVVNFLTYPWLFDYCSLLHRRAVSVVAQRDSTDEILHRPSSNQHRLPYSFVSFTTVWYCEECAPAVYTLSLSS